MDKIEMVYFRACSQNNVSTVDRKNLEEWASSNHTQKQRIFTKKFDITNCYTIDILWAELVSPSV